MKTKTRFHKLTAWMLTLAMLMTVIPTFSLTAFAAETVFPIELLTGTSATIDEGTEFEITYENKSAHGQNIILSDADGLITAASEPEGGILEVSADGPRSGILNGYDFAENGPRFAAFEIGEIGESVSLTGGAVALHSADIESIMVNGVKVEVIPGRATVTVNGDGTAAVCCADGKVRVNKDIDCSSGTVLTIGKTGMADTSGVITLEKGSVCNVSDESAAEIKVGGETISLEPSRRLEYYDEEQCIDGFTFTPQEGTGYVVIYNEEGYELSIVSGTGAVAVAAEEASMELMYNGNQTVTVDDKQYASDTLKFITVGEGIEMSFSKTADGIAFSAGEEPVVVEGTDEGEMYTAYVGKYQVVFDTNGHGSQIEAQQVAHGDKVEEPAAPVAEGYEFMGWYDQNSKKWDFESDSVAGRTNLYAEWKVAEGYYDLFVGGTWVTEANAADVFGDGRVSYVHDAENNSGTLTLKNYTYTGAGYRYYSGKDEYNALIYSGLGDLAIRLEGENVLTSNNSGAFEVYGIYTAFPVAGTNLGSFTVQGDGTLKLSGVGYGMLLNGCDLVVDGAELAVDSRYLGIHVSDSGARIESGSTINISSESSGIFSFGNLSISGSEIAIESMDDSIYAGGDVSVSDSTVKIYANEKGIHTFGNIAIDSGNVMVETLSLCLDAGTVNIGSGTVLYGKNSDGSGAVRALDAITIEPTLNILIPSEGRVGTLDGVVAIVDEAGATISELLIGSPAHTWKDKYALNNTHHWKVCGEADCCFLPEDSLHRGYEGSAYATHDTNGEKDSCSVCGYLQSVTVTFNPNGGSVELETMETVNGKLESLPVPTRSGYTFNGWYDAETGGNKITTDTVFAENTTVYAQWTKKFSGGGGSFSSTSTTTTKNEDGSKTVVTENKETGTKTEITTNTDGSTATVETKKDGTVTTTEKYKDGTKVKTETTADGETTAEVEAKSETVVVIPISDAEEVYEVVVTDEKGNETVITDFEIVDGGIAITVDGNASVSLSKGSRKEFADVHLVDHWAEESVDYVYIRGLMKGTSEKHFSPDVHLTRAMLVTVLYRLEGEPEITDGKSFADVENGSYYEKAVAWAKANGIVNGTSATTFEPNSNITREQIAVIMHRYADFKGYNVQMGENTNILSYDDVHHVSEYAISAMQYAVGSGIIKGKSESALNPLDNATRAEVAAILHRFIEAN